MLVLCLGLFNSYNGTQWLDEGTGGDWEFRRVRLLLVAEIFLEATGELGNDGGERIDARLSMEL